MLIDKVFNKGDIKQRDVALSGRVFSSLISALRSIGRQDVDVQAIINRNTENGEVDQESVEREIDQETGSKAQDFMAIIGGFINRFEQEELGKKYIINENIVLERSHGYISIITEDGRNPIVKFQPIPDELNNVAGIEIELKRDKDDQSYTSKIVFKDHMVTSETTIYDANGEFIQENEHLYLDRPENSNHVCEYQKTRNGEPIIQGSVSQITAGATTAGFLLVSSSKYATYLITDDLAKESTMDSVHDYSESRDPECRAEILEKTRKFLNEKYRTQEGQSKK